MVTRQHAVARAGPVLLVLALTACDPADSTGGVAPSADPDRPGYQQYEDGGPVGRHITGLRLSGQMQLKVQAGATTSVHRTVHYQDTDPGSGTWRVAGDAVELSGCTVPRCLVTYDVTVPASTALSGELNSGNALVRGIGPVDLSARSGTVDIQQISGAVKLEAGSTAANVTNVDGPVDATVDSGQFTAQNVHGPLSVHGGSGTVVAHGISGPATLDLRSAEVTLGMASAQDVSASVSSGSLGITVPQSAYHVVSTTDSSELNSTVPDDPAGAHRITLALNSASASLDFG
ncbi:hypothetical protein GCM10022222_35130 [Amycolatopsis ultiminotia]|uniref:Adhesin n=1 Tax=Amycolatopsis ultiminotia TaxID=543629 RepID=A0ABP6WC99_9PSEU